MTLRLSGIDTLSVLLRQQWAAARVWTAHRAPYLACAVLALQPVVVEQLDGAEYDLSAFPTDPAWHIYLDPQVLAATGVPEIGFWLLHQTTHLLRDHADRYPGAAAGHSTPLVGRGPDQRRWNLAGDAEIDDDLYVEELTVPARAVTPAGLNLPEALLAEQYWAELAGTAPHQDQPDCGSGVDGQPRMWDAGAAGLSSVGQKLLRLDVARRIREHVQARGTVPAGWQRWSGELLEPVVDWRRLLRAALRRGIADVAGRVDFTYRRPSRRASAFSGVVLPSLRQPVPTVAVVIDTSASMSDDMLAQVLGEVDGLLRGVGIGRNRLHVVCCDAQAHAAQRVLNAKEVQLLGGGGTDMRAGLDAAAALRPVPDLVIVLTDGLTPWPRRPPGKTRVLVGLMDQAGSAPPWATSVLIEPTKARAR
jgi:predicted metal-dependent peptidase